MGQAMPAVSSNWSARGQIGICICSTPFAASGNSRAGLIFDKSRNLLRHHCLRRRRCRLRFQTGAVGLSSGTTSHFTSFTGGSDGANPYSTLAFDAKGSLYGTTMYGGGYGYGMVFKLAPGTDGWTKTSIHEFTGGSDGGYPYSGLVLDSNGNLYGTTPWWGGSGVAFEITP